MVEPEALVALMRPKKQVNNHGLLGRSRSCSHHVPITVICQPPLYSTLSAPPYRARSFDRVAMPSLLNNCQAVKQAATAKAAFFCCPSHWYIRALVHRCCLSCDTPIPRSHPWSFSSRHTLSARARDILSLNAPPSFPLSPRRYFNPPSHDTFVAIGAGHQSPISRQVAAFGVPPWMAWRHK
ncbi:hypothetical protein BOTBODRAFT_330807 [Botryobasidium botryosum FD-172 SS1]|uniref:Uncharacterized protein n=1 Tax=Botryobasidium botryosum (strain FD-172 SS1) TaxID=930990 RepID=A0A067MH58_BOTB1|nr:hypothetical protein BOTBODRAFT_330807 [Botryobasidium botryosum FD-172 SS1]